MTLLHSTMAPLDSTTLYHGSTWLYYTLPRLCYILPCLYLTLHESTTFYHGSTGYANGRARELDANGGAKQFRGTGWELVMHAGNWYYGKGLGCVTLQCALLLVNV